MKKRTKVEKEKRARRSTDMKEMGHETQMRLRAQESIISPRF